MVLKTDRNLKGSLEGKSHEQEVGRVNNINIICDESENEQYLLLAEFFKLCGIFVIKTVRDSYEELRQSDSKWVPDQVLDIRRGNESQKNVADDRLFLLNSIKRLGLENYEDIEELEELADIYIDNKLKQHSMKERYFYDPSHERIKKCVEGFEQAYEDILTLLQTKEAGRYKEYFSLTCLRKINSLRGKLRIEKIENGYTLIKKAVQLSAKYEDFAQGYILAGIIADGDLNYLTYSIHFYKKALAEIKKAPPVCAYVYFKIARYYEKIEYDEEKALKKYYEAYKLDKQNYRALYKIALLELNKGYICWEDSYIRIAMEDFNSIYTIMYNDLKNKNLEPIQLEYLVKTYKKLYEIYDIWLYEKRSAEQALQSLCSFEEIIDGNCFFDAFFGNEEAKQERRSLKKHLDLQIYKKLRFDLIEGNSDHRKDKAYAG